MQGILYEEHSAWLFVLVTVLLGGWMAWMTGRAVARSWGSLLRALIWSVPIAMAVRFIHFALFGGTLLSAHFALVDLLVVAALAALSWRLARAGQMARQYPWLFERTGPLTWRAKGQPGAEVTSSIR